MKSENKQVCEDFEPPLRFLIQIDLVTLIAMSDLLGRLLLEEPLVAKQVIQEVVHLSVKALGQLPYISGEQVQVTIRLQSFPSVPDVCMGPDTKVTGLARMQGVLVARTAPGKYVVSAVYRCPVATCKNSRGRRSTRLLVTSPRCRLCGSDLEEVPRARDIGDQVVGFLLPHGALTAVAKGRHQALMVCFTDDLTCDLELGVDYSVVGYNDSDMFHTWRVSRWRSPYTMLTQELPLLVLPPAIHQLYLGVSECSPQSPWLFVVSLAACIGSDFYPGDTFLHLKLGLLLSLASQGCSRPVPVLAVGAETLVASRLMCRAGALAQRYVPVTSLGLFSSVGGVEHVDDNKSCWCEAGALLFSATGVCHLGDWAKLKQATARSHIQSAVESGVVPIETTGLLASGPSSATTIYPLRSSVWTYQAPPRGNKPSERAQLKTLIKSPKAPQHLVTSAIHCRQRWETRASVGLKAGCHAITQSGQ
ncbi:unnamed protein product [Timema podura]|uniref:MCMDC2 N-terminal domain-containing protein n=1 Tax=Timema podura TaxID=61482 RepID=A0ABN7NRB6_TIMPD|nr:unnamed protein product [Timema podura]